MSITTTTRFLSRVDYVRSRDFTEDMQVYLLSGDAFKITRSVVSEAMAGTWRGIFEGLAESGYMRRSQTGRYHWNRYVVRTAPAGPGRVSWLVYDTTLKTGSAPVKGGEIRFPVQNTQDEINEAWARAESAGRAALAALR
jgi:hypothetical protein